MFRIAEAIFLGQTNQRLAGLVQFDDIEVKHMFAGVQSWRRPLGLDWATKNPLLLKTKQY